MALIRIPIALSPTGISETRRVKAQNLTHYCWWPAIHDLKWGLPSRPIYRTVISEFRLGYRQIPQYWVVVFSPAILLNQFPKQRFTTSVWPSVCGWYALRNSSIVPNFFHQVIRAKNRPVRRLYELERERRSESRKNRFLTICGISRLGLATPSFAWLRPVESPNLDGRGWICAISN